MTIADALVIALAAFRYAYLIVFEEAPFHVIETARYKWTNATIRGYPLRFIIDLNCIYCVSVWTTIGAYFLQRSAWGAEINTVAALAVAPIFVIEALKRLRR